ncbi:MAG: bacteriohopanetetrol glucosamine biosynthesis glycosyltransferase HpnI, partial [Thiotrichales bacterium]|nr:bacteriohopanetetrol glucosamine biosynthesis glycosyltransferase HpnI [Thiotrichales bacterium]
MIHILLYLSSFICLLSFGYLLTSLFAIERFRRLRQAPEQTFRPPVTVFKPVCGLDPDMEENLRSFCRQDYPQYQILFGLRDKHDPALEIIQKVLSDLPDVDADIIINPRLHGTNHKVSNLINMYPQAKHDFILIADSDMRVPAGYLNQVMAPFAESRIGAVTCLYSGTARGGMASALNAMFINGWFLPSVLISGLIEKTRFCLGATMIVRRDVLEQIGGLKELNDHLADDYMLGKLVTDAGYDIHLSYFVVSNIVQETSVRSLVLHELRWARTLKTVEPLRYAMTFLTDTLVISIITAVLARFAGGYLLLPAGIVVLALLLRMTLHTRVRSILELEHAGSIFLVPIRDCLSFILRIGSFTGSYVHWRNQDFSVDKQGLIHE